ncbi:MAG: hypothetical protein GX786_05130, partial [Clostridiales bacterium]|nr:hypothetical protein [Clostridiales bacterium]
MAYQQKPNRKGKSTTTGTGRNGNWESKSSDRKDNEGRTPQKHSSGGNRKTRR